ncbi:MAG: 4-hydroxy-tetrahydrodipicolinate synthase [Candidatus Rickettsia vulgarisii]
MSNNIFTGLITALITPFKNNQLDFDSLEKIINYQIDNKVDGIVVGGSTGEGTSLTMQEYRDLLQAAVKIAGKRLPIISGCSSNSTNLAIEMVKISEEAGVDGFMCSVPPYVKPMQEGIYLHFEALHNASNLSIMLYSVPSRTIFDFTDETILRLSKLSRIIALKDAYNDLERPIRLKNMIDKEFNLLCGNDEIALSYNAQGGVGCVSVTSNVMPKLCKELQDSCKNNDYHKALAIQRQLSPLYKSLFLESNPIGVKYATHKLGLCTNELRLPLTPATNNTQEKINKVISKYV